MTYSKTSNKCATTSTKYTIGLSNCKIDLLYNTIGLTLCYNIRMKNAAEMPDTFYSSVQTLATFQRGRITHDIGSEFGEFLLSVQKYTNTDGYFSPDQIDLFNELVQRAFIIEKPRSIFVTPEEIVFNNQTTADIIFNATYVLSQEAEESIPAHIRFALHPSHHDWLHSFQNFWKEKGSPESIRLFQQSQVYLPLLLEIFNIQLWESLPECMISGPAAAMIWSASMNANKFSSEIAAPTVHMIEEDGGYLVSIVNESRNRHVLEGAYPRRRNINFQERGLAREHYRGTGIGAITSQDVYAPLCGGDYSLWETKETPPDIYQYDTRIFIPKDQVSTEIK